MSSFSVSPAIASYGAIRAIAGSFLALCTIFVAARLYVRRAQKARYEADDWLMVPAWLFFVGIAAGMIQATYMGWLGYTATEAIQYHINPDAYNDARLQITLDVFFALCLGLVKLSALQFYKRVFCVHGQPSGFKTIIHITMVVVVLWIVAFIILPLSQCGTHINGYWIRPIFNQYCLGPGHAYLAATSASDTFLELVVVLLPIRKIWSLHTNVHKKAAITLVFLTALLSLAAALARLVIVSKLLENQVTAADQVALANSAIYSIWLLECGSAIVAINMPSLWTLRHRKAPEKMLQSFRSMISLRSRASTKGSTKDSMKASSLGARSDDPASMELGSTEHSKVDTYISSEQGFPTSRARMNNGY